MQDGEVYMTHFMEQMLFQKMTTLKGQPLITPQEEKSNNFCKRIFR